MSKAHLTRRGARRAERIRRKLFTRIIVAGFIIVLLAAAIWWLVVTIQQTKLAATPSPTVNLTPIATPTPTTDPAAPSMLIDVTKQYFATVKMVKGGEFVIQLFPDKSPITVNSFVFLARKGFFDNTTFHRVLEGFMAQGGDPTGTGSGGPGYEFANESNNLTFNKAGVVAMANAGRDTNGSQFFITFGAVSLSENDYTIFGQVISGMDVVNAITRRDPSTNPAFNGDAIDSITITEK
jgi:cyclophilin family peptidyl-prolyl cis-trans isomerase